MLLVLIGIPLFGVGLSVLTSELTGAAGSSQNGVAGCHRVRRRTNRYAFMGYYFNTLNAGVIFSLLAALQNSVSKV